MLQLILGRAKSGKTAETMQRIRARGAAGAGRSILLVPEQYSHEAERELLRVCGDGMSRYAEVLSFTRLWARVEGELGRDGRALLSAGGRLLCMARALDAVGSRLVIYGAARRQLPLQQELLKAIDELKTCRIAPEALRAAAGEAQETLRDKLCDLALIAEAYDAYAARSGLDPLDRLTLLAERIGRSSFARASFYIDGFTDFTAQQNEVIAALLRAGAEVCVCLTCQGLEESLEIFEPSRRAALHLRRIAERCGAVCEITLRDEPEAEGAMAVLERELFRFGAAEYDARGAVRLVYAPDAMGECEYAAARCLELVRTRKCRWRDIAIAARDFTPYAAALEQVFARCGIPLFCAKKSALAEMPPAALVASAYAAVTGGWEYEDIFRYLKTGLAGLTAEEVDELENYAFLWSLHGRAWRDDADWRSHPDGFAGEFTDETREKLRRINALRRRAVQPLQRLALRAGAAVSAEEQAHALADFFEALALPEALEAHAAALRARGQVQEAAEYAQLWEAMVDALEQCAAVLGEVEMDAEQFGRLYLLVLSAYDVGSVPLRLDRVSAGDMDRMRRRALKHLIVLGCDSGALPRAGGEECIFTEDEREALHAAQLDLGDTPAQKLAREFALIYNCFTLPAETLSLSWRLNAGDGAQATPAFPLLRAAEVFQLTPEAVDTERCRASAPNSALELAAAAEGGSGSPLAAAARRWFAERGEDAMLEKLAAAAQQKRGQLSRAAVRALYGEHLRLSASRVDKLASCPFSYFLQYGLKAKPRQPAEFNPPELGSFLHFVLERVARAISENGGFAEAKPEEVARLCDEAIACYIHEKLNDFREKSPRFLYLFRRLTRDVRAVVADMAEELKKSEFQPMDFELNFGAADFDPISLGEGADAMTLVGVADRVDGWVHEGKLYLRVVDYKTGRRSFSLADVWYGMGLQMLLYLFALERSGAQRYGQEIVPAGVLYIPARDVLIRADADMSAEEILAEKRRAKRRSGLLLDDEAVLDAMECGAEKQYLPVSFKNEHYSGEALASAERFGLLAKHIDATLRALARELRAGCIAADPWFRSQTENACALCDYAEACHFNAAEDRIRYLGRQKTAEVWSKLEEGGAQA